MRGTMQMLMNVSAGGNSGYRWDLSK